MITIEDIIDPIEKAAVQTLSNTIAYSLRHPYYDRTKEVAEWARQIMTGKDQAEYILRWKERESKDLKEQRLRLYNSPTKEVANLIYKSYNEINSGTDDLKREIINTKPDDTKTIESKLSEFYGKKEYDAFIFERTKYYQFYDPNAFGVFEKKEERSIALSGAERVENITPYLFEVTSEQAVNYCFQHGEYKWLIVRHVQPKTNLPKLKNNTANKLENDQIKSTGVTGVHGVTGQKELETYYMYTDTNQVVLTEYDNTDKEAALTPDQREAINAGSTIEIVTIGGVKTFIYQFNSPGFNRIPFFKFGSIHDPCTPNSDIFVTPLEPASEIFRDMISIKSMFNITLAMHTFLQKIVYGETCTHEHETYGCCERGYYGGIKEEGMICQKCEGEGTLHHASGQDLVVIKWPEGEEQPAPLDRFAHYIQLPHETPRFQKEQLEDTMRRVWVAIFGTQTFEAAQLGKTATEIIDNSRTRQDCLHEVAVKVSEAWELGVNVIADYLEITDGEYFHQYPKLFAIEGVAELLTKIKIAKEAGASAVTVKAIEDKLNAKLFTNNSGMLQDIRAFDEFKPFADKSVDEITAILSDRANDDFDKIAHENFDQICKGINCELAGGQRFYKLPFTKRKELWNAEVLKTGAEIKYLGSAAIESFGFETIEE